MADDAVDGDGCAQDNCKAKVVHASSDDSPDLKGDGGDTSRKAEGGKIGSQPKWVGMVEMAASRSRSARRMMSGWVKTVGISRVATVRRRLVQRSYRQARTSGFSPAPSRR